MYHCVRLIKFFQLVSCLVGLCVLTNSWAAAPIYESRENCSIGSSTADFSRQLVTEVNSLRANPRTYIPILMAQFAHLNAQGRYLNHGVWYSTREGMKAVHEAIEFLKKAQPKAPLSFSGCLSKAAQQHVNDQGSKGGFGHQGSDGRMPSERAKAYVGAVEPYCGENISYGPRTAQEVVVQLLVDDGVPSRGHRANLFDARYHSIGIGAGFHKTFGYMSVQLLCLNPVVR